VDFNIQLNISKITPVFRLRKILRFARYSKPVGIRSIRLLAGKARFGGIDSHVDAAGREAVSSRARTPARRRRSINRSIDLNPSQSIH